MMNEIRFFNEIDFNNPIDALDTIKNEIKNGTGYAKESIIELCLSHVAGNKVQQAYNRGTYLEERRKIMTEWNDFVEQCYLKSLTMNS